MATGDVRIDGFAKIGRLFSNRKLSFVGLQSSAAADPGLAARPDVVTTAAQRLPEAARKLADADALKAARSLYRTATRDGPSSPEFGELLDAVAQWPGEARFQVMAARVAGAQTGPTEQLKIWNCLLERFPADRDALRLRLRWYVRETDGEMARAQMAAIVAGLPKDFDADLYQVVLLREFRDRDKIAEAFESLIERHELEEQAHLRYAEWLQEVGNLNQANSVLRDGVRVARTTARLKRAAESIAEKLIKVPSILGVTEMNGSVSEMAVRRILTDEITVARRAARQSGNLVGSVAMVTGSLGMGGAERQLTTTALGVHAAAKQGRRVGDFDVVGPVTVVCRSLHSRAAGDFFHADLVKAGVPVHEYREFSEFGGAARRSMVTDWREVIEFLPPQMRDGTARLTDYLRVLGPQVLHLWQDGMVFAAGLAGVLARVPRIILSVRTVPPIDRMERNKPEYPVLFREWLGLSGVRLSANSRFAADRYASWLELPPGKVSVVYNGVSRLPSQAQANSQSIWSAFDGQTGPSSLTVGSVMRLDDNKRPRLWLEVASMVLRTMPDARFVVVGDGPLIEAAKAAAESLGIARRVLFTGRRHDVGFWLSKMDAFMLLSRHEGLPNVTIEAQLSGLPIVATPAGGTSETIYPAGRRFLLSSAENADPLEAAARLRDLGDPATREKIGRAAQAWATSTFSIDQMIASTLELYCA